MNMSFFISKNDLENVKIFFTLNVELCGHILFKYEEKKIYNLENESSILYINSVGEKNYCNIKIDPVYVWHTHSNISKGYPSFQDILMPVTTIIHSSVIFTKWGIWELFSTKKNLKENKEKIEKDIKYYLDKIYFDTEKGRKEKILKDDSIKIDKNMKKIKKVLKKYDIDFQSSFTSWENIENQYQVKF